MNQRYDPDDGDPKTAPAHPVSSRDRPDPLAPQVDGQLIAPGRGAAGGPDEAGANSHTPAVSRRGLLRVAGVSGVAGFTVGTISGVAGHALAAEGDTGTTPLNSLGSTAIPFYGAKQAGITTPLQAHAHLLALDLLPGIRREQAAALMRRLTRAAAAMAEGNPPADDNQIALDAGPCSLTITFGFGASFLTKTGLGSLLPPALEPLPAFSSDALDSKRCGGDLLVQICADDALVAFHALRLLQRLARPTARIRWQMNGFNRTPGATATSMTARNLMGQLDGTNNPKPEEKDFNATVFVQKPAHRRDGDADPAWMVNGTYGVVRRIRMLLDAWDELALEAQERVIGRRKDTGAPLSGGDEDSPVNLAKEFADGDLAIARDAHIRVASPDSNRGAAMLRRPFSYHDGYDDRGVPDAGLLFIAWQADPRRAFTPVQRKLDRGDALSRFIRHESSALFAAPGGCRSGEYIGQRLLES